MRSGPRAGAQDGSPTRERSRESDFRELGRVCRSFGTLATGFVLTVYLLYILLSDFAPAFMDIPLIGHLTVGLALGLVQFAVLFLTSWRYARHMRTRVDPLADELRARVSRPSTSDGAR